MKTPIMSQAELEEFVGMELVQIGRNAFSTNDGMFTVRRVSYVEIMGISDPKKSPWFGESPWKIGNEVEIKKKIFVDSEESSELPSDDHTYSPMSAKDYLRNSYKFIEVLDAWWIKRTGQSYKIASASYRRRAVRLAQLK